MNERKENLIKSITKRFGSDLLAKKDVQLTLSISSAKLDRMIAKSEISYTKLGTSQGAAVRFLVDDVVDMLLSNYVTAYHTNN